MSNSPPPPFLSAARLLAVGPQIAQYQSILHDKTPNHTSEMSGEKYVEHPLESTNSRRTIDVLRMPQETFLALCDWSTENGTSVATQSLP